MDLLTKNTEVKVKTDSETGVVERYGRIHKTSGEEATGVSETIPEGWVEVIFNPFHQELFKKSQLKISEYE